MSPLKKYHLKKEGLPSGASRSIRFKPIRIHSQVAPVPAVVNDRVAYKDVDLAGAGDVAVGYKVSIHRGIPSRTTQH
jgi:hypothetical protein